MKKDKKAYCPGCGKHCPMYSVRCKYGRNYFAKLEKKERLRHADGERGKTCDSSAVATPDICCAAGECGKTSDSLTMAATEIFHMDREREKACDGASMAAPDTCASGVRGKKRRKKWEKYVAGGGALWQLLYTARRVKKAVRNGEMKEADLLSALDAEDRERLSEILQKLNRQLEGN